MDPTDKHFQEYTIVRVRAEPEAPRWMVYTRDDGAILVPGAECSIAPAVNETLRLYGRGTGYPVRGILCGGRVYRYEPLPTREALTDRASDALKALRDNARDRSLNGDAIAYDAAITAIESRRYL